MKGKAYRQDGLLISGSVRMMADVATHNELSKSLILSGAERNASIIEQLAEAEEKLYPAGR